MVGLNSLAGWAAQASLDFSLEISHASMQQQARSRRLLAILKAAFSEHPRCSGLIFILLRGSFVDG